LNPGQDPKEPVVLSFPSFVVPMGVNGNSNSVENCKIKMVDSFNRPYTMKLKGFPTDFPTRIPNQMKNDDTCPINQPRPCPDPWPNASQIAQINPQFIDCTGNTNQDVLLAWCKNIFVYQQKDINNHHLPTEYFVIMGGPAPCDRVPNACLK